MKNKNFQRPIDLLDIILDKDNKDPIVLMDEKGRQIVLNKYVLFLIKETMKKFYTLY